MDNIQDTLRFCIIFIFLELPAFDHRAAVGDFHSIEIVFDNDGAFLGGGEGRDDGERGCACHGRAGGLADPWCRRGRGGSGGARRRVGSCGSRLSWLIPLRQLGRGFWRKEAGPQQDYTHGEERSKEDAHLRGERFFLRSIAHSRPSLETASEQLTADAVNFDGISSHFSGTGS